MKMRQNLIDIYRIFSEDETLLRLLKNKPTDANDDPLDVAKPSILSLPDAEKWAIIEDVIKFTPKVDDLDTSEKCRLLFYAGIRKSTGNYLVSDQDLTIDILCHFAYENVDLRSSWIADQVNDLVFDKRNTGIGKTLFKSGGGISAPKNYVGYRLVYTFGSGNKSIG